MNALNNVTLQVFNRNCMDIEGLSRIFSDINVIMYFYDY